MRVYKIAVLILAGMSAAFIGYEVSWRNQQVRQIAPSPTGHYIAKVSTVFFGHLPIGTQVFVWPKWAPIPSLIARQVLDAPCSATVEWITDRELHIKCPTPEGAPQVQFHPWALEIILEMPNVRSPTGQVGANNCS
jgi:hypothetical protein